MEIKDKIEKILGREIVLVHPKSLDNGDYSLIVDEKTAEEDFRKLEENKPDSISKIELVKPRFINFYLSKKFFADSLGEIIDKGDAFGKSEHANGYKVVVEHSQPNPFKDFHIGHLMNNVLGEAVSRIFKWNGAEVKTASYHGDVGLHVAKAIWGKIKEPSLSWGQAYTLGDKSYEENKEEIVVLNKKIYDRSDEKINTLYDEGRKESLDSFDKIYARLGSEFDFHYFESESGKVGKKIVLENIGNVFEESEGAVVFKGENFEPKTHTRVFLNKEGLPTYEAKEVGLAQIKKNAWGSDLSITLTANEQDSFFNVVEVAIGEVFPELKGKLKHLSHGMLKFSTGKMSSRTGNIISAEELIEEVKEKTKGEEEVAIGAIKYMILRQGIGGDIIFDIEKSVSVEGNSGVYLQYAHARASSILEKAKSIQSRNSGILSDRETHEIERLLYRFPEIVERAGAEYAPHYIVTYLTELASSFNNFYANEPVLPSTKLGASDDSPESSNRLAIVGAFQIVMKNGLSVLGVPAPDRV